MIYLLLQKKRADKGLNKPKTKGIIVLAAVFFAVFFFVSIGIPSIQTSIGQAAAQQTESVTDDKADSENNAASNDNGPSTVYDRFLATDKDGVDSYSSGRTIIWKRFAEDLNLMGHDITQVNWPMLTGGSGYAHNTFLEFSYRSGIPVGILFLALELAVGIVVIRIFFTGKGMNECFVMILLVTIAFLFESTLDIGSLPFIRFTPLLYYIGIATIISADHPKQGSMINLEK